MAEPSEPAKPSEAASAASTSRVDPNLTKDELRKRLRQLELEAGRMPFFEHLRELRDRLRNAIIAAIGGFAIAYYFSQELYVLLVRPLANVQAELMESNPAVGQSLSLHFTDLTGPFWTYFSISFWAGFLIASPFIFYQLWKFIAPGLYKGERKIGVWFSFFSAVLFIGGAAFCYSFVLEPVYRFLLDYASGNLAEMQKGLGVDYKLGDKTISLTPMLTMDGYLSFAKKILIGFGLAFELPLVVFFLSLIGMVDHRKLWKFNRWAAILAFVIAAMLTPPDIVSQSFLAGPIIVLYNISIVISYFVTRARERKEAAFLKDDDGDDGDDDDDDDDGTPKPPPNPLAS